MESQNVSAHDARQELVSAPSSILPRRWLIAVSWAAILLLAAGLRFYHLDASYWIDEINTHDRAAAGLAHAWSDETPLAYVLSWASLSLLGDTEAVLRLPSCLAGVACVFALLWIGMRTGGLLVGLLAGFLLATSSYQIYWSQLARYYTFTTLFGLGLLWALHRGIETRRWPYWLLAMLCTTLGALTHLTFLPIAGAIYLGAGLYLIRRPKKHFRLILALVLSFMAGMALPTSKNATQVALMVMPADMATSAGAAPAAEAPALPKPSYRLTWDTYRYFLQAYFPVLADNGILRWTGLIAGLGGLVCMWRRFPPLSAMMLSGIVVLPLPFMLIDVHHVHYSRYYCFLVPLWHLSMAAGAAWSVEILGRLSLRRSATGSILIQPDTPPSRIRNGIQVLLQVALLAVVVAALQAGIRAELRNYYGRTPARDWRGMAEVMAPVIQADDIVLYGNYQEILLERVKFELGFYLDELAPMGTSRGANWRWCADPESAAAVLRANPLRTVWLVGDDTWPDVLPPDFFERLGRKPKDSGQRFGAATLWTFGQPTVNLCKVPVEPVIALSADEDEISTPEQFSVEIGPTEYGIRNAGFVLWNGAQPVGWEVVENARPYVAKSTAGLDKGPCMKLLPGAPERALSQDIAEGPSPGMRIRVEAKLRARNGGVARIGTRWLADGVEHYAYEDVATTPDWTEGAVEFLVPENALPNSVALILGRGSAGGTTVYIDNIKVKALSPLLDPARTYTLSLELKHINSDRYPFDLRLSGIDSNGESFSQILLRPPFLSKDWHRATFTVIPGSSIPSKIQNLSLELNLEEPEDQQVWISDVQFESGEFPTPFTKVPRLPHDEWLGATP